jgi:BMFP domain-containing protein YqiC
MPQTSNRLLDDIARLMTDVAGAAQGVGREFESVVKGQIERLLRDMDIATREEVEVLRDMVVATREENERLALRVRTLEAELGKGATAGPASATGPRNPQGV